MKTTMRRKEAHVLGSLKYIKRTKGSQSLNSEVKYIKKRKAKRNY